METREMGPRPVAFILSEGNGAISRENIVVAAEQEIAPGAPLSRVLEASSSAKDGGNTGNGTFVLDGTTPVLAGAKPGVYTLRCVIVPVAGQHDGRFEMKDPDEFSLGLYAIPTGGGGSVTIANDIKGVLTDGNPNFALGDGFDIEVSETGEYAAYVPGGMLPDVLAMYGAKTGEDETAKIAAFARDGEVNGNLLAYPSGCNVAAVNAALARNRIIVR